MDIEIIEIFESLAVIVASIFAIYGINSWRREMKGRKEFELAEEVLALFYEAQDKIRAIRSPMGWAGEGESRKAGLEETEEEKRILDQAYAVFERYQKNQEPFNRLHALRYRFMVVFGREKAKPFDELRGLLSEIFIASRRLSQLWLRQIRPIRRKQIEEKLLSDINKYEAIFWEGMGDPDPISPKLNGIVSEVEQICEEILRQESGWLPKIFFRRK